jgi:hypothetical protein
MKHILYICICCSYYISEISTWLLSGLTTATSLLQLVGAEPALARHQRYNTIYSG